MPKRKRDNRYGMTPETRTPSREELGVGSGEEIPFSAMQVEERFSLTLAERPMTVRAHKRLLRHFGAILENAWQKVPQGLQSWLIGMADDLDRQLTEYEVATQIWRWENCSRQEFPSDESPWKESLARLRPSVPRKAPDHDHPIVNMALAPPSPNLPVPVKPAPITVSEPETARCFFPECSSTDIPENGWFVVRLLDGRPDPSGAAEPRPFCVSHLAMISSSIRGVFHGVVGTKARAAANEHNRELLEAIKQLVASMVPA